VSFSYNNEIFVASLNSVSSKAGLLFPTQISERLCSQVCAGLQGQSVHLPFLPATDNFKGAECVYPTQDRVEWINHLKKYDKYVPAALKISNLDFIFMGFVWFSL
jgi:hypothetical protein